MANQTAMRILLSAVTLLLPALVAGTTRTGYVQSSGCSGGSGFQVQKSMALYGASLVNGYSYGKCTVQIKAQTTYKRLMIRFTKLDMTSLDTVDIYDGTSTIYGKLNSYPLKGKDSYPDKVYKSSGRYLTLVFNARSSDTWTYGFTSLVTEFDTGVCLSSEFECCTGDCIASSLRHDGDNNCKDKSDESYSDCDNFVVTWSVWVYVGSAIGGVVFLVVVGTIIGCCVCASQRSRPRNVPPPSVTYPGGGGVAITTASAAYPQQAYAPGPQPPQPYPQAQGHAMAPPHYDVATQGINPPYPTSTENKY